jgi:hypothetical protein
VTNWKEGLEGSFVTVIFTAFPFSFMHLFMKGTQSIQLQCFHLLLTIRLFFVSYLGKHTFFGTVLHNLHFIKIFSVYGIRVQFVSLSNLNIIYNNTILVTLSLYVK